ncbi:hypothetical protein RD792_012115 [Penstemon davidsonii]|uniref:Bet v I/Major latex protein domain-containing protein n=1 Tax=Penstemon davidsonii TaxID=160366 RepID=A0ABR0CWC9_9LAMI|nr:hypothetical protein RD792_012115 [Penstemon davidsonii]
MGLHGKLVAAVEFKAGGDLYHELFRYNPNKVADITPEKIQGCDLHEGEFGKVGSIVTWSTEGKAKFARNLIEAADEEKKMIKYKVLEGDLMEEYKEFVATCHIETKGGIDLVTWTFEYETRNDDGEPPISLLAYFIAFTKDIENHHAVKN